MKFSELKAGDRFTRQNSETLIWTKDAQYTAYGHITDQNASCKHSSGVGPWHCDHVSDDEEITKVTQ